MGTIVLTNDDGVHAEGLGALHRAMLERGLDVVVVAPSENRSGVSRNATYGEPVVLSPVEGDERVLSCSGTPVDCVRAALLGDVAPDATLVVSGINHGANLGDDNLNSGTVGAAIEAALLGVHALAISQQSHVGFFHILDALDQTATVYDETARIGALAAELALECGGWPDRLVLNLNVPAEVDDARAQVDVTRLGRRYYTRGSVARGETEAGHTFRTYGDRTDPAPPFEDAPGTDFAAIAAGNLSLTPLSYAWGIESGGPGLAWTQEQAIRLASALERERAGARRG
jgi:5'-nucleotidase